MKNVLLLFTDQQRSDTIGALGNSVIQTPALDSLAADSAVFTRCYTPSPVCVPARLCMMQGVYPNRSGCNDNADGFRYTGKTLYERFSEQGYTTMGVGKMHFSCDPYGLHGFSQRKTQEELAAPQDDYYQYLVQNGYNEVFDYNGQRSEMYYIPQISRLPQKDHPTQWVGDQAVEFLKKQPQEQPFFLMASFIHPHPPFAPPIPWNKLYRRDLPKPFVPEESQGLISYHNLLQNRYKGLSVGIDEHLLQVIKGFYYACVSFVDYQIGRIIAQLKERGMYEDTVILFSSDHGELLGDYNCLGKRTMLDAACNVPLLIKSGEGHCVRRDPASLVDIAPTLLSLAQIPYKKEDFDGVNLIEQRHEVVYSQFSSGDTGLYMVSSGEDKLIYSEADRKYWYFNAFPEAHNAYQTGDERICFLQKKLEEYRRCDCGPSVRTDVAKEIENCRQKPYQDYRQDHVYLHEKELAAMPEGYHIDL